MNTPEPVVSTIHVDEFLTAACGHCKMALVRLAGTWRHLISGEVECAWSPDEQPIGMGHQPK